MRCMGELGLSKSPDTADSLSETQKTVTANCLLSPNRAFYVERSQNSTFEKLLLGTHFVPNRVAQEQCRSKHLVSQTQRTKAAPEE